MYDEGSEVEIHEGPDGSYVLTVDGGIIEVAANHDRALRFKQAIEERLEQGPASASDLEAAAEDVW